MRPNQMLIQAVSLSHKPFNPVTVHRLFEAAFGNHEGCLKGKSPTYFLRLPESNTDGVSADRAAGFPEEPAYFLAGL